VKSGLLLVVVLSVCTCWFHNTVTLTSRLVSTDFGTCWYQCSLSNPIPLFPVYDEGIPEDALHHVSLSIVLTAILCMLI
jgi:hypothetical protein